MPQTSVQGKRLSDSLSDETLLGWLREMQLIREFETRCMQNYQQAKIGGFCHLHIGQEAAAAGSILPLHRDDYARIAADRHYFGDFDPFGDFDLTFGAAKQNLRIVEVPIRYRARTYGEIKISRFRHGLLLLRMTGLALWKFEFSQSRA